MRLLFHCAFKGTNYHGWQWQKDQSTVQATLESAFQKVFDATNIHGCCRTDAGVHASQYFIHTDLNFLPTDEHIYILNKNLPNDIAVLNVIPVDQKFNAQLNAISRTYRYFIHTNYDPMISDLSTWIDFEPEESQMRQGLALIKGTHDFKNFTLTPDRQKNTICHIISTDLKRSANGQFYCFEFKADHFLRGMVRLLVNELLTIGEGKRNIKQMKERLIKGTQNQLSKTAFPQGLYLSQVEYPGLSIPRIASEAFVVDE